MKNLKMPTSDSYHDYLIESLKDPEEAAGYIEVVLEEGSDEPELLRKGIRNVAEARAKTNNFTEAIKEHHEKLDKILSESGGSEIYALVELLDAMGFCLQVSVKENHP